MNVKMDSQKVWYASGESDLGPTVTKHLKNGNKQSGMKEKKGLEENRRIDMHSFNSTNSWI